LFKRWPQARFKFKEPELIPKDRADKYPALAVDLGTVAAVIYPTFREYDIGALRAQNSFWRQQVALIIVTALTTGFAAVQAAYLHQIWPGIVVAVLGVLSAAVAGLGEERAAQRAYLEQRTRAQRLRALAFSYLAELPPFEGTDRRLRLVNAVTDIRAGREPV
jgi:Protein of unknown function (DUF4231)